MDLTFYTSVFLKKPLSSHLTLLVALKTVFIMLSKYPPFLFHGGSDEGLSAAR